jgi:glycosyltransferase 2 family protein
VINSSDRIKNRKKVQNVITLIVFGLAAYLVLPQIATLANSWQVLLKMLLWAVGLAFLAQVLSYFGSGYLLQKTLKLSRQIVTLGRSTLIVLGAASISLVAGGTVGSSAAIFRWTKGKEGSVGGATLASLLPSLFNSLTLVFFSIFGLVHLILLHDLSQIQLIGFSITLFFLGVVIALSILASARRNRTSQLILKVSRGWARLRHKSFDPVPIQKEIDNIFIDWDELWKGKWYQLAIGSFLNTIFDMMTLYFLFVAAGQAITIGELLSGYALPLLLGRIAFILPGGVGVVESSMAALYTGLGVSNASAVVVVLAYRLISFWIPSISGFPVAAFLEKSHRKNLIRMKSSFNE